MSTVERTLRRRAGGAAARCSAASRSSVLERVLPSLEGGTLEVRLPDGADAAASASGRPVRIEIDDARFFRRLATRGKLALGESYTAGEWRADDLVAFFELLLRNADTATARHPRLQPRRSSSGRRCAPATACAARGATSATTTTSATTSSSSSSTRR